MTTLLESRVVWSGLGWLCLLAFSLWFIALLFPIQGASDEPAFDNGENHKSQENVTPIEAHGLYQQKRSPDETHTR